MNFFYSLIGLSLTTISDGNQKQWCCLRWRKMNNNLEETGYLKLENTQILKERIISFKIIWIFSTLKFSQKSIVISGSKLCQLGYFHSRHKMHLNRSGSLHEPLPLTRRFILQQFTIQECLIKTKAGEYRCLYARQV